MRGVLLPAALVAAALSSAIPAAAQQPPLDIELKLSPQDIAVIEQGLIELPMKIAVPVYNRVTEQVRAATEKKPEPPAAEDKK